MSGAKVPTRENLLRECRFGSNLLSTLCCTFYTIKSRCNEVDWTAQSREAESRKLDASFLSKTGLLLLSLGMIIQIAMSLCSVLLVTGLILLLTNYYLYSMVSRFYFICRGNKSCCCETFCQYMRYTVFVSTKVPRLRRFLLIPLVLFIIVVKMDTHYRSVCNNASSKTWISQLGPPTLNDATERE